jgi:hypothetical protein
LSREERRWLIWFGVALVVASVILFAVHYAVFRDARNLFFYLLHGIAFIPLQVLIVGMVIERLIALRDKRSLEHKLNMVIGAFYSEVGSSLLAELLPAVCAGAPEIKQRLNLRASWKKEDFAEAVRFVRSLNCEVDLTRIDLEALRTHLYAQRTFVLRLLESPNLIEHERFTDLLWALLHLEEELEARPSLTGLSSADEAHLRVDARRAYNALLAGWLQYVEHLKADYPYLFSLVVRTHPFQDTPSPIVTE